eukprot:8501441-Alexandrium_andersonii.AAC.1
MNVKDESIHVNRRVVTREHGAVARIISKLRTGCEEDILQSADQRYRDNDLCLRLRAPNVKVCAPAIRWVLGDFRRTSL